MVDFKTTVEHLRVTGFNPNPDLVKIAIPDAKAALWNGLRYYLGDKAEWLPCYDEIAEWLSGNDGRGLLCYGSCGLGKTVICGKIIPVLLNHYHRKVVSIYEADSMNSHIDSVKEKHILYIDDIGTEGESVKYGERRMAFPEIVDAAEKKGKLLICSTNLALADLKAKYGERTTDRLKAITRQVLFTGNSFRR
jgi:DNA replication protein DnaC